MERKLHILLADDSPDDRALIRRVLEREFSSLQLEEITSATEFDQALAASCPDLLITDFQLDWTDGLAILRAVKAAQPDCPVVMFTSSGNEEVAVEAMKAGADEYILKSYAHIPRLPSLVRTVIERADQRRSLREAENRYRALFDSVPVSLYRAASDGKVIDANLALARLVGCPDRESLLTSAALETYITPQDRQQILALLESQGIVRNFETRVRRPDGTVLWLEHNAQAIRDAEGKVLYYDGTLEDITGRKQAEMALQRRNRDLAVFNQVGLTLAATLDLHQVLDQVLLAVTETIGAEGSSVWMWDELHEGCLVCRAASHPGPDEALINMRLQPGQGVAGWVAENGRSAIVPCAPNDPHFAGNIDAQTGFRTMSILAAPLRVREGIIGVVEVVNKLNGDFDASDDALIETLATWAAIAIDNARLIEVLRQRTVELQARNEELDAFAHTVAHDLKNPLGLILGYTELLEQDFSTFPEKQQQQCLQTILQSSTKMQNIVDELLLLSETRKVEVKHRPLDMASIVAEAQRRLSHMADEYQAEMIMPPASAWPAAMGHAPWVEQVWVNYISNALKYGGRPPHVELGAESQPDGMVRFWVRDNGPGLTPEAQARLFTPFTRLAQVNVAGHGLGLSIVQRIVEKLGGQASAESQIGQGSIFSFTLPAAPQPLVEAQNTLSVIDPS
jgi:PAS domain S-box-containing protein